MSSAIEVDDKTFDAFVKKNKTALIDCFAVWCGPCRMLAPILDQVAAETAGKVGVAKLDVDKAPETAMKYGIMAVPTLLFFKNGALVETLTGVRSKDEIKRKLLG
ncbi:MAG: thioredoxin [Thermoplasmata archaeon HGW-Thermoplasmata-2]|nr:MAG: thioredoxin [Thermoplasmata archaeon HGW-Thermoplasmata-2]